MNVYFILDIENIYRLFIQLRLVITNPEKTNETTLPISILNELAEICNHLANRKDQSTIDIFEILLKNYLLLLDTNQFITVIADQCLSVNNNFLSDLYNSLNPNIIIEMEYTNRVKMYYRLLHQINSSTRLLSFIKNELNTEEIVTDSCRIIFRLILRVLYYLQEDGISLSILELKKYETILFNPLVIFIDEYFSRNKPSKDEILITPILIFLRITSQETSIIPIFINVQCPKLCLQWLSLDCLKSEEYESIINILNNISQHDEGIIILKELQCADVFYKFTKDVLSTKIDYIVNYEKYEKLRFAIDVMILSAQNSNDLQSINDYEPIRNILLPAIETSLTSSTFMYLGFHTSELLFILMKLFNNDNIINFILEKYTISVFFSDTLQKLLINIKNESNKNILSIIVLANIFWSISFQDQYKNDLIQSNNLLPTLEIILINYVSSYTLLSRQIFTLKRAIDGIKQNLYPIKPTAISTTNKPLYSVMISYSYINQDFYRKIYETLIKTSTISIYTDADSWKQIAQNIEQSDVILFLISKDFLTNKSCRQELIYVVDILKKPFIPIFIDQNFAPTDWLNKRIDGLKCIHFDERNFTESCDELLSMMNEIVSMEKNSSDISQWSDKEVKQWFIDNNLIGELYEFYQFQNGHELLLYGQAIPTVSWTREYERIKSRFEKKFQEQDKQLSPHEFLKFINALDRIKY